MLLFSIALIFAAAVIYANIIAFHSGLTPEESQHLFLKHRVAPVSVIKTCLSDDESRKLGAVTGIQAIAVLGGGAGRPGNWRHAELEQGAVPPHRRSAPVHAKERV
jgi:hypothetical protein